MDNQALGNTFLSRPLLEGGDDFPIFAMKIQMPNFNGLDPLGWLAHIEQYFQINHKLDSLKLQLALVCMEGTALHWARWLEDRSSNLTWPEFRKQLLRCYAGKMTANPYEFIVATKQSRSINEYIREFEARAT